MPPEDHECVQFCLDGHPDAYRHLVERHQAPLMRYLGAMLGDAESAAEAAQEAFVRAYFTLPKLRKPQAFFSWLVGIADRVAKENRRAARRCPSADLEHVKQPGTEDGRLADWRSEVGDAVATLPEPYREVILLRFYGGRSCDEISRDLGVPLGTVTKRLSRAYALLRDRLADGDRCRRSEVPS